MKKFLICLLTFSLFFIWPQTIMAGNKIGIHIGDHFNSFDQAADVVKSGGWVIVMACPGDADKIQAMIQSHPELNIIIRGHYPHQQLDRNWALSWVGTLGNLQTPNKIYFMPWNEPNQAGEADYGSPGEVVNYVNNLAGLLDEAGLRGSKIKLLSPMVNYTHHNFFSYVQAIRSHDDRFFSQFDGIALNLYDLCGDPLSCNDQQKNPAKFNEILAAMGAAGKPVYGVESGTMGPHPYFNSQPVYGSPLYKFIERFINEGTKMFAIPAYDLAGEVGHAWNLFNPPDVVNLMSSLAQPSSPSAASSSWNSTFIENYSLITCLNAITVGLNESYCAGCVGSTEVPGVLYPLNSTICNDTEIEYKSEADSFDFSLPDSEEKKLEDLAGELRLDKLSFPDFAGIEINLAQALPKLLSLNQQKEFEISQAPLKTEMVNFVSGINESGETIASEQNPKSSFDQPGWFSKILAQSWIACGLAGGCRGPKTLKIGVIQPEIINPAAATGFCSIGNLPPGKTIQNLQNPQTAFAASSWLTRIIQGIFDELGELFKKEITTVAKFKKQSRGTLVGGATFNQNTTRSYGALLPANTDLAGSGPVENDADFSISENFTIIGDEDANYGLAQGQKAFCLQQCALHQAGYNIKEEHPFCPSCNPNDYPLESNWP